MSLYSDLVKLEQDIVSGADVATLWADFKAVGDDMIGPNVMQAAGASDAGEVKAQCAAVETAAKARLKVAKAAPVGKLGDGAILKLILEALPMILALFA